MGALKKTHAEPGAGSGRPSRRLLGAAALAAAAIVAGCASSAPPGDADAPVPDTPAAGLETASEVPPEASDVASSPEELAERWGVEVVALRRTAAGYMLDFRYRVLDPDKAAELFVRANKPTVIHHATGARMPVHNPAKTGPLRPTNTPEAGRIYFIMFANARGVVQPGDAVTIEIGEFAADVVVVE